MSSIVRINNQRKRILLLGKCQADSLDNTTLTSEKEYSINLLSSRTKFV